MKCTCTECVCVLIACKMGQFFSLLRLAICLLQFLLFGDDVPKNELVVKIIQISTTSFEIISAVCWISATVEWKKYSKFSIFRQSVLYAIHIVIMSGNVADSFLLDHVHRYSSLRMVFCFSVNFILGAASLFILAFADNKKSHSRQLLIRTYRFSEARSDRKRG